MTESEKCYSRLAHSSTGWTYEQAVKKITDERLLYRVMTLENVYVKALVTVLNSPCPQRAIGKLGVPDEQKGTIRDVVAHLRGSDET